MNWTIVLVVLGVFFLLCIVLQIVYIRTSLATFDKDKYTILNNNSLACNNNANNSIKVYGLDIHKNHTIVVNDVFKARKDSELSLSIPDNVYVFCGKAPISKEIRYTDGLWLIVKKNEGCSNLLHDTVTKQTKYIVVDNMTYTIHFDRELKEKMLSALSGNPGIDWPIFDDQEMFVLTKLSQSFRVVDTGMNDGDTCSLNSGMNVFKLYGSNNTKDVIETIRETTSSSIALIIIGFSTV